MGPEIFRQVRHAARRLRGAVPLAAALAWLAPAAPAQAQFVDSETAEIQSAVLEPGSIVKVSDMDFGQIVPSPTGGSITMSTGASPTCTATGGMIHSGMCRAARFTIMHRRNRTVFLRSTPNGPVILTGPGGATMTLNSISLTPVGMTSQNGGNGWNLGTFKINAGTDIADFYLGGRLNVGAMQAPGVYHGTINVQVQLN